jgi:hypothetical protein
MTFSSSDIIPRNRTQKLNELLCHRHFQHKASTVCRASNANVSWEPDIQMWVASVAADQLDNWAFRGCMKKLLLLVPSWRPSSVASPARSTLLTEATILCKLSIQLLNRVFRRYILNKSWSICNPVTDFTAPYQKQHSTFYSSSHSVKRWMQRQSAAEKRSTALQRNLQVPIFFLLLFWFVRLLALRPLVAYCASLGW